MAAAKNFAKQMRRVQDCEILPADRYEMREFKVDDCGSSVIVSRRYGPVGANLTYSECWRIGPRGAKKVVYSHINY